jgi:hypothetical protein
MKNLFYLVVLTIVAVLPISCLKNSCVETVELTIAQPILLENVNFRINPEWLSPQPIEKAGKIYTFGSYLLINEYLQGIHIYDNSTPSNPVPLGFLSVPGNVDMTFDGNYLHVDSYTDLLSIQWNSPGSFSLVNRRENVFEESFSKWDNKLVAYYETRDTIVDFDCHKRRRGWFFFSDSEIAFDQIGISGRVESSAGFNNFSSSNVGKAGSLSRFARVREYLYTVSDQSLSAFKIQNDGSANLVSNQKLGFGIETIFPFNNILLVGAVDGLHTIDITQPDNPILTSRFDHARACDPVVADGNLAYVTLRSGTTCPGGSNRLEVINVADVFRPFLVATHEMKHPHGLGKWNEYLFVCEGTHGVRVFDARDPSLIGNRKISEYAGITTYDVIPLSLSNIIVTGPDGVYQFDFSDKKNLKLVSKISRS